MDARRRSSRSILEPPSVSPLTPDNSPPAMPTEPRDNVPTVAQQELRKRKRSDSSDSYESPLPRRHHQSDAPRARKNPTGPKAKPSPKDINDGKPEPYGMSPVSAEKRAALSNAVPYFRQHQSSVYSINLVAYGMFVDALVGNRDQFLSQIIITTVGGGRVLDLTNKQMTRTEDQGTTGTNYKALMNAYQNKHPVVMVAGAGNRLFPVKPRHYFSVLDYFHITDLWTEATTNEKGDIVKHYMIRFEKIDLQSRSWWTPKYGPEPDKHLVGEYRCKVRACSVCKDQSKEIFEQGWTCLNKACDQFSKFDRAIDVDSLRYNIDFLRERTAYSGNPPEFPLVPSLPSSALVESGEKFGTEKEYKGGIVCPRCSFASRRIQWERWVCENEECDFSYTVPMRKVPTDHIEGETRALMDRKKTKFFLKHGSVMESEEEIKGYETKVFYLPGESEDDSPASIVGSVTIFRPLRRTCENTGGPNDLFEAMQDSMKAGEIKLKRNPARNRDHHMEELTSHFTSNIGADYKFGVVVKTSSGFDEAPAPALEALGRLTWAGKTATRKASEDTKEREIDVSKESMPDEFMDFNEELILGYFEESRISYHDDGEKELGPTVATLSLGSPSLMFFRPKKRTTIGDPSKAKRGDRPPMLGFVLEHGDMVVMHGRDIHKYYEHKVDPEGVLRFALTCRYIRPETIQDQSRRAEALKNGTVPKHWKENQYKGEDEEAIEPEISEGPEEPEQSNDTYNVLGDDEIAGNIIPLSAKDRFMSSLTELNDIRVTNPGLIEQLSEENKQAISGICGAVLKEASDI
ncbi:hypothetical protein F5X99DRAFT_429281 [Biscogniauxia marginata]|nr:hypothetical protein F5X99DRAFT_429281 [Biscogniauxia marginata]